MATWYFQGLWLVREGLRLGIAALFFIAFASALRQFPALLGENGLLRTRDFVARVPFSQAPSLFHWRYSDRLLAVVAWTGMALSVVAGLSPFGGMVALDMLVWLLLWALYLSIVNVGQTFYAFGWESLLLEAGFFAVFMGPRGVAPMPLSILLFRWLLFRVELGAGLIKLRHDPCWRDLTCLYYHHETQPLPNPLTWYFHWLPRGVHRSGVVFSHLV